jgi:Domain of unknown function (DUF4082)/Secretion system C-terminal sorting domain
MISSLQLHFSGIRRLCFLFLFLFSVISHSFSQTIFTTQTPVAVTDNDHKATVGQEVGVKFRSSVAGFISGIRFYKTAGNTGTHTGELYSSAGVRLAQAVFTGESATGWQTVSFTSPIAIAAATTYTAAYFSSLGNYVEDNDYFRGHTVTNSPLTAPADGTGGASGTDPGNGQGTYKYSAAPVFPNQLYRSANYWVDVLFSTSSTPVVANAGSDQALHFPNVTSVTLNGSASTGPISSYAWTLVSGPSAVTIATPSAVSTSVTGLNHIGTYIFRLSLNGGVSTSTMSVVVSYPAPVAAPSYSNSGEPIILPFNTTNLIAIPVGLADGEVTGYLWKQLSGPNTAVVSSLTGQNPTATGLIAGVYVFQLKAFGPGAPGVDSATTTFTVVPPGLAANIFTTQIPAEGTTTNGTGMELGVKFRSSFPGYISGVRFYKTAGNSGSHIGELYTSSGTRLAQATFASETATGWQTVMFSTPVAITAGTTYVAAYFSPNGTFTLTPNYFTSEVDNYPLTALKDGDDGSNGVFNVGSSPIFPIGVHPNTSNYWVDVVYSNGNGVVKADAGLNQTIYSPVTSASLSGAASTGPISSYKWTILSAPSAGDGALTTPLAITTTATGLIPATVTFGLDEGIYTFQLSVNGGVSISQVQVKVKTTPAPALSTIFTTQTPLAVTHNDHQATVGQEVGVKFNSTVAGYITGIRFYKTSGNTGTHIGELYSSTGTRLAQATFTGETATGWQTVNFSSPVAVTAGATYTAAYFSSLGNYTEDNDYFLHHSVTNSPLTAFADGTNGASGTDPGTGQGTYKYTASPAFPSQLYRSANYWVDVVFSTEPAITASPSKLNTAKATEEISDSAQILTYSLGQNYPNPVAQNTKIEYSIPVSSGVKLVLYDIQGRPVRILVNETKNAGRYSYDLNTGVLAKGLYIYSMHAGNFHAVKKLVIQ